MNIFDLKLVKTNIDASNKEDLFDMMINDLYEHDVISSKEGYSHAVREREAVLSTGIGHGIAIPHGRHQVVNELKAAVYILSKDLDYDALDGNPVRIVFMLAVPSVCTSEYMKVLGFISKTLHNEDNRELFLNSKDPLEIFDFLSRMQDEL